jgi:hypothetical protein
LEWQEVSHNNDKVKNIPGIKKIAPGSFPFCQYLQNKLGNKNANNQMIGKEQDALMLCSKLTERFNTNQNTCNDNDDNNQNLKCL